MLSSPNASERLLERDHEDGLTPIVPSFTGLVSHVVPLESLERYKLVGRLGHGGMAEVFLAAWEVAPFEHRPVVVKRLHSHFTEDPRLVQMFLDEARLLCLLDHPHVVKTLEAGVIDGHCCIAMEYLEGQPLHRVLRRAYQRGKLPIQAAVNIAICVLEGLHYAHEKSDATGQPLEIVHRDVSPQNVFVTNDGQVKVLDFGIAKARSHEGRTATGVVKGKVGYIAPEQAAGESVDRRADVWSVGVLLWEALTGVRLFKADSDAGTLNQSLRGEIPNAAVHRPGLPLALQVVLAQALQRPPALRYGTAGAMQKDLQDWQKAMSYSDNPGALGALMRELFESEILEQRRLVSVLMARSDCTAPLPISGPPSSTSALIVSNHSPSGTDLSGPRRLTDDSGRPHGVRSILATLALFAGFAAGVAYLAFSKFDPGATPRAARAPEQRTASASDLRARAPTIIDLDAFAAASATAVPTVPSATPLARPALAARPLRAGAATKLHLSATAKPLPGPNPDLAGSGFLTLDTSPWSQVSVAGKLLGQTPLVGVRLPSGTQLLSLRNPELGIETSYTVQIDAGKTTVRRIGIE